MLHATTATTGVGIIQAANPDGSVGPTPPLAATLGNQIVVSIQRDEQTVSTCVVLARRRAGSPNATYCASSVRCAAAQ